MPEPSPLDRRPWLAGVACLAGALLMAGAGLLPGHILLPLDLLADTGAWKPDPAVRVPVSNALLSDPVLQFHPWDVQVRRSLAAGRVPWTNPYAGEGEPLFANPQAALLSPFTWPRLLLGTKGWALCVLARLLAAGLGLWLFARELGCSRGASLVSGLVFMLSGFSVVWALYPHANVFAVLPWFAFALRRLLVRPSAPAAAGAILCAAIATAGGHPETLAFGVLGLALFLWLEERSSGRPAGRSLRPTILALFASACGFLLLSLQLVPFALLLSGSRLVALRSATGAEGPRLFAMAAQVLPGFLGSPLAGEIDLSGAFPGSENMTMRSEAFVGLLVLAAIALSFRRLARVFRRGLLVAGLALAVCWRMPPLGWMWRRVPIVRLLAPEYAAVVVVFFAALAAGPAVESLASVATGSVRAARTLIIVGILVAAVGVVPSLAPAQPTVRAALREWIVRLRERGHLRLGPAVYEGRLARYASGVQETALRRIALPGSLWAIGGVALLLGRRRFALFGLAAVGELGAFAAGYIPAISEARVPARPPAIEDLLRRLEGSSTLIAAAGDIYPPDLATVDGLRDIRSFGLLESSESVAGLQACGYDEAHGGFPERPGESALRCLAGRGVGYLIARQPPPGTTRVGGLDPPAAGVYALPTGRPAAPAREGPPRGLAGGSLLSALAALSAVVVVRAARERGI